MVDDALFQGKKLLSELRLEIVYLPIDQLRPNPDNARVHRKTQLRKLAKAIRTNGFINPALIDTARNVIAGHCRIEAARLAGLSEIATICLGTMSEPQKQALALADNRLHDESFWDDRLLAEQLKVLSSLEVQFDLETTGFDLGEIDVRIESLNAPTTAQDPADHLPLPSSTVPISIADDVWQLGRHRIICGNALDPKAFARLMEGERAKAIFADVPFNVKINGHVSGLGKAQHREFAMAAGEMSSAEFQNFLRQAFRLFARHSTDGSLIVIDWGHLQDAMTAGGDVYNELKNLRVWAKHNAGMGSFYRSQHEPVLVYKHVARHIATTSSSAAMAGIVVTSGITQAPIILDVEPKKAIFRPSTQP